MSASAFPVFDLGRFESATSEERRAMGAQVDDICRSTGFLAIANHGVAQAVIDGVWRKARDFFDLPAEVKQQAKAPYKGYPYGYLGPELEALARSRDVDSPPDLKESFNGGPASAPIARRSSDVALSKRPRSNTGKVEADMTKLRCAGFRRC